MPFWLGNPGVSVALPSPNKGLTPTLDLPAAVGKTIGGGQVVSRAPGPGRRIYSLAWTALDPVSYSLLEEFRTGARGPGPHALLDPGRRNLLSLNQSSATSATSAASGFTADAGEGLLSTTDLWLRGPRSLRWRLPAVVTSGVLRFDPPAGLVGIPAPPGMAWTFSCWLSLTGAAASVTVTPVLSWRRADGIEVATTLGSPVAAVAGSWVFCSVSGGPLAGGVALGAQLQVTPGTIASVTAMPTVIGMGRRVRAPSRPATLTARVITANRLVIQGLGRTRPPSRTGFLVEPAQMSTSDVVVDKPMLDLWPTPRAWVLGTGVPRVSVTDLPETYRTLPDRDCTATLVEVG